jgi:hypothetical protein
VVDWDDIANQITRKQMEMDAKKAAYDLHAMINKGVADEVKRLAIVHQTNVND